MPLKNILHIGHGTKKTRPIVTDENKPYDHGGKENTHARQKKLVVAGIPEKQPVLGKKRQAWDEKQGKNTDCSEPTVQKRFKSHMTVTSSPQKVVKPSATRVTSGIPLPFKSKRSRQPASKLAIAKNWDFAGLKRRIDEIEPETRLLPEGVRDIDRDADYFHCTEYAEDIIAYLKEQERLCACDPAAWSSGDEMCANYRSILVDWLVQVQDHLELTDETLHAAVMLTDRFQMKWKIALNRLQLLGVAALFVTAKIFERFPPTVDRLVRLTDNAYDYEDVIQMERIVLRSMDFCFAFPTAVDFLGRFHRVEPPDNMISVLSRYLLDLCLPDIKTLPFLPSVRAAASVYLSRRILCPSTPTWTLSLHYYTGYSSSQILACVTRFHRLLCKVPTAKFTGAIKKYDCVDYCNISTHHVHPNLHPDALKVLTLV